MHRAELQQLLDDLAPSNGDERGRVEAFRELIALPGDIFSRDHFDPGHITASAMLVSDDWASVVLVDHRRLGVWLQPGGHVDPTDTSLRAAALREAVEECGPLELEVLGFFDLDVHQIPAAKGEPAHAHYDLRFLCQVRSGELAHTGEVEAVEWFPLDATPARLGSSVDRLVAKVQRAAPEA